MPSFSAWQIGPFREIPPPDLLTDEPLFERENSAWELADSLLSPVGTRTVPIIMMDQCWELERPVWRGNFDGF